MSLYKDRVAAGLCGMCGKPSDTGGPLCSVDLEKARVRIAKKRAALGKHVCIGSGCGKPIAVGTRCDDCKAKAKASRQRSTVRRKAEGQCTNCTRPAKPGRTLCQEHIDAMSAVSSRRYWQRKEAGLCRFCDNPPTEQAGSMCAYHHGVAKDYRFKVKVEAFDAYGGPVCAGCGNADFEVLEIDHIDGGGRKHRRETNAGGGYTMHLWLRRNGYPAGFRVLCPTCNKKAYRGIPLPNEKLQPAT